MNKEGQKDVLVKEKLNGDAGFINFIELGRSSSVLGCMVGSLCLAHCVLRAL